LTSALDDARAGKELNAVGVATGMVGLSLALELGGQPAEALNAMKQADELVKSAVGLKHRYSALSTRALAERSFAVGRDDDAFALMQSALEVGAAAVGAAAANLTLSDTVGGGSVVVTLVGQAQIDADGDGYGSIESGGDDCDDTSATAYPGATEVWYDGIDQDCAGDNDYDQDGDGVASDTDCNDTDASTTGPVAETLDGLDTDCDGVIDDVAIGDVASGVLYGGSSSLGLGDADGLSLGDRLCLAVGRRLKCDVLTADTAWAHLPGVVLIRKGAGRS
jgi:hypothetical protein